MKKIIIESLVLSEKTAIVEDDKLVELLIEENKNNKLVSNIYRGIVKNVKAGLEACFVDIGFEKLAYLPLKKDSSIKSGMDIMVQINKEAIGTKGAKLSEEISLSGRYLVYIPSNDRITISNRLQDEEERFRLKKLVKSFVGKDCGIIIRTEANGCSKEELEKDFNELKEKYDLICKEFKLGIGPKLLYKELDFSSKYINDNINEDVEVIVVNNEQKYKEIKNILKHINKDYISKLKLQENEDIFDLYRIQSQIEKSLNKKVWLKSGGYLIIENTEALTVIDVNTGKFTGSGSREDTVYKTNLEACEEIARQLRLRDIGGIIIVDFIDMIKKKNKENLLKTLNNHMQKDKRKSEILGLTRLGLVEIARRREKSSISDYYLEDCIFCDSTLSSKSINFLIDDIEKEVMKIKYHTSYSDLELELNPIALKKVKSNYMDIINKIREKYKIKISLKENEKISNEKYKIIFVS
ncbi:Rne/Rng family ribonuclease [Terrisporobacter sp.]|uniref:Rne/Rng family ribonuclease n=1 Tax=Terrisporobacter sp. TaxID=1965305 RepID=UPI002610F0EC|nr:Rne/Rng family ribonuclease [Terrisporobacter sp.]